MNLGYADLLLKFLFQLRRKLDKLCPLGGDGNVIGDLDFTPDVFGNQFFKDLVNKNAKLCRSIDELLEKEGDGVQQEALKGLMQKIFRKHIHYPLNEKPFDPKLVAALIQLRKTTLLDDSQVAGLLNDISRRIVKDKGPVVMNTLGYSEKALRRKLAVQALFGKIFYLSELPEFCGRDGSLIVKEIFGVADANWQIALEVEAKVLCGKSTPCATIIALECLGALIWTIRGVFKKESLDFRSMEEPQDHVFSSCQIVKDWLLWEVEEVTIIIQVVVFTDYSLKLELLQA
ncbi:hypothetical protein L2E82_31009 [Cichorium intybus]|uniref:Uncharacterized protein n=1 Tax=Cichorium intybus TaxID=13427 RepID=A0ACB9D238_CICIN|nr:hypothetical protein L2E82_31009 [Cichorium intybus]